MHCIIDLCLTLKVHRLSIQQKKNNTQKEKNETNNEGATNKSIKILKLF